MECVFHGVEARLIFITDGGFMDGYLLNPMFLAATKEWTDDALIIDIGADCILADIEGAPLIEFELTSEDQKKNNRRFNDGFN